ncbi:MAG: hypothetical protein O3B22_14520 [Proteobacteria bacterium]|nr:hypothetical protein [Pseudomonadota bacterium]MDA0952998.1 hypothetical protein [Pseudomonadota bacterium]MDA1069867.1 hypothetical protein [Pseudomonadota bacterium]
MACAAAMTVPEAGLSDIHIGRLLQRRGYINEHQLVEALQAQAAAGGRLGTILVRRGCLSEDQLHAALRTQDDLRRGGVVFDVAAVAAAGDGRPGLHLALSVAVPPAGGVGGLAHHGIATHQHILVPGTWLPCGVVASDGSSADGLVLTADDGRMLDFEVGIAMRASDETIALRPGKAVACPRGELREGGFEALVMRIAISADSLRDGGSGRFAGMLGLHFAVPG